MVRCEPFYNLAFQYFIVNTMPKSTQTSLFDTYESVNSSAQSSDAPVHIKMAKEDDVEVRKLKKSFHKGLLEIRRIKNEIENFDKSVQKLGDRYQSEISPILMELNKIQLDGLEALDKAYQKKSYTMYEKEALKEIIIQEIDHLVTAGGTLPDKFQSYMELPDDQKELLVDMFKEQYGFDVDVDDVVGEGKLNEEDFRAKYQEFFGQEEKRKRSLLLSLWI